MVCSALPLKMETARLRWASVFAACRYTPPDDATRLTTGPRLLNPRSAFSLALNRVIRATTIFNVNNTRPRAFLLFSEMTTDLLYALLCVSAETSMGEDHDPPRSTGGSQRSRSA